MGVNVEEYRVVLVGFPCLETGRVWQLPEESPEELWDVLRAEAPLASTACLFYLQPPGGSSWVPVFLLQEPCTP